MRDMRLSSTTVVYPRGALGQAVNDVRSAALSGIEIQGHHANWLLADRAREEWFIELLEQSGLTVSAVMLGYLGTEGDVSKHLQAVGLASRLGASTLPVMAPRRGFGDLSDFIYRAERLADVAGQSRIEVPIHHHLGTIINSPDDVDRFLDTTGAESALGILLDTAHLALHGLEIGDCIRRWGDQIRYVHVKDLAGDCPVDAEHAGARAAQPYFRVPGDGVLDLGHAVRMLREANEDVWLSIEIETFHRKPLESLQVAKLNLGGLLK